MTILLNGVTSLLGRVFMWQSKGDNSKIIFMKLF